MKKKKKKDKGITEGLPRITGVFIVAGCVKCKASLQFHGQRKSEKGSVVEYVGGKCPDCGSENHIYFTPEKPEGPMSWTSKLISIVIKASDLKLSGKKRGKKKTK